MHVVNCTAPAGVLEPAPFTSLPLCGADARGQASAFWTDDDGYRLRVETPDGVTWYRIESGAVAEEPKDAATRFAMSTFLANVTPIGGGRIAFPAGSTGRVVYRVWRGRRSVRTRILAVRAARSRRLPA